MKSWHVDILLAIGCIVGAVLAMGGESGSSILGPADGPRAVITIHESAHTTPRIANTLNDLRLHEWGDSIYRHYDPDQNGIESLVKLHDPPSLIIGTLDDEQTIGEVLYAGPFPDDAAIVYSLLKEHGGGN